MFLWNWALVYPQTEKAEIACIFWQVCSCGFSRFKDLQFSVQLSYRHNRVFVVQDGANFVCHYEKCKEKRAVHMASEVTFVCDHAKLVESHSHPSSAKNLTEEDIAIYKCDNSTRTALLEAIHPPQDLRHVVQISAHCYAVFHGASQGPSNPIGYCHVLKDSAGHWHCTNKSCKVVTASR